MSLVILFTGYVIIDRYTFQTKRNVIDDKALENTHIIIAHTRPPSFIHFLAFWF